MNYCEICDTEIGVSVVICPKCEMRLLSAKKTKPKKRKIKKRKIYIINVSYILFIVFLISYINIGSSCFKSNNIKCINMSFVFLILFGCFCFIAAVLVGEDLPKWKK
jgi:hypothetical protein